MRSNWTALSSPRATTCLATNRDDHGRNHAFLYDETTRTWALAPAYDLNPNVANVLIALGWLGSTQIPVQFSALLKLAEIGGVAPGTARDVYEQVEAAVVDGVSAFDVRRLIAKSSPSPTP